MGDQGVQELANKSSASLIQPLFAGPLDIVGDVHGEIEALHNLMHHLGYSDDGNHPEGRRLVFLGDLVDRGPDSPSVVVLVRRLVESGRAQCVLGNHDFNVLRGKTKHDNNWFFGKEFANKEGKVVPQVLADESVRQWVNELFQSLPLALERDDLRVVHACWHDEMVKIARETGGTLALYQTYADSIDQDLRDRSDLDEIGEGLEKQNRNPVKVLTSGLERRAKEPFRAGGKVRNEERVHWWEDYTGQQFCVFGHYSLTVDGPEGNEHACCADYSVGKRWQERLESDFHGAFKKTKLAAVRFPEKRVIFDDGTSFPCADLDPS